MLLESEIYESLIANKKYLPLFTVNKKAEKNILQISSLYIKLTPPCSVTCTGIIRAGSMGTTQ